MDAYPEADGETDVVFCAHWTLSGTDGTYSGSAYGATGVSVSSTEPFTPYADLTEAQVIGWVQDAMGAESVATYEGSIATQIANQTY